MSDEEVWPTRSKPTYQQLEAENARLRKDRDGFERECNARAANIDRLREEVEYQNERWAHERKLHAQTREERDRLREALEEIANLSGPITMCWFEARAIVARVLGETND